MALTDQAQALIDLTNRGARRIQGFEKEAHSKQKEVGSVMAETKQTL